MHVQTLCHFSWLSYSGVRWLSSVGSVCFSPEKLLSCLRRAALNPARDAHKLCLLCTLEYQYFVLSVVKSVCGRCVCAGTIICAYVRDTYAYVGVLALHVFLGGQGLMLGVLF